MAVSVLGNEEWCEAFRHWNDALWAAGARSFEVQEICSHETMPGFFIAACYGLIGLAKQLRNCRMYQGAEVLNHLNNQRYPALISANSLRQGLVAKLMAAPNIDQTESTHLSQNVCLAEDVVAEFLSMGASANLFTTSNYTNAGRLVLGCVLGSFSESSLCNIIQLFISEGLDINAHGKDGRTFFHLAAQYSLLDVMAWLLDQHASLEFRSSRLHARTPLEEAVRLHQSDAVKFLLDRGADRRPSDTGNTLWHLAVQSLLEFDVNFAKFIQSIEPSTFDGPNHQHYTPLMLAVMRSATAWATYLLRLGAKTSSLPAVGEPSLACCSAATRTGGPYQVAQMLHLLSTCGLDFNTSDAHGTTPLMVAASRQDLVVIRFLLKLGADAGAADHAGRTALHYSVHSSDGNADHDEPRVLEALVRAGTDVEQRDHNGVTALMLLSVSGAPQGFAYLNSQSVRRLRWADTGDEITTCLNEDEAAAAKVIDDLGHVATLRRVDFDFQKSLRDRYGGPLFHFAVSAWGYDAQEMEDTFERAAAWVRGTTIAPF